jgi:hypothetical protein
MRKDHDAAKNDSGVRNSRTGCWFFVSTALRGERALSDPARW